MATKAKTTILFLSLLIFATTLAFSSSRGEEEERRQCRELEQCKEDCRKQGRQQRRECEQQCQQKYEKEGGDDSRRGEAETRLEQCQQQCREGRQGQQQQWDCEQKCQQQYEQERHEQEVRRERLQECKKDCEQWQQSEPQQQHCEIQCEKQYGRDDINPSSEEEKQRARRNPYVFERESFQQCVKSEHGNIWVLQNFTQKSQLLAGLANYQLAVLEADPNTFVVPHHLDADSVFYVLSGEGTITLIQQDQDRESYNIKQGDIVMVPSGTVVYLINRSNNQRLRIVKLLKPVSTPGQFEVFYTVGGEQPQSYYRVFSTEILQAALDARGDQLERLFGRQRQGVIIKATREQISALSSHSSSSKHGGVWPFGGRESEGTFNLLNSDPKYSNNHGSLREAIAKDYQPLKDINIGVSFTNITSGSMMEPFYNSKAIEICMVNEGYGYFEMACPHLSSQKGSQEQWKGQEQEQKTKQQYQKVRSPVSKNTVFIVPTGHPIAIVASKEQNLGVVCFGINSKGNKRTFVAGKDNVVSKMEAEAKELAFGVPSKLVDNVFGGTQDKAFSHGPEQSEREEEGGHHPL